MKLSNSQVSTLAITCSILLLVAGKSYGTTSLTDLRCELSFSAAPADSDTTCYACWETFISGRPWHYMEEDIGEGIWEGPPHEEWYPGSCWGSKCMHETPCIIIEEENEQWAIQLSSVDGNELKIILNLYSGIVLYNEERQALQKWGGCNRNIVVLHIPCSPSQIKTLEGGN